MSEQSKTQDAPAPNVVRVFDTTLRDGEQAPGFAMSGAQKLRLANALADLEVDVIEAGFAAASPCDAAAIRTISEQVEGPTICSLARAVDADIRAAADALSSSARKRIHVFIATSPLHRSAKLGMSRAEVLEAARRGVGLARSLSDDVEFSAEDAVRTEPDFLAEALSVAASEGASVLNVPDTIGYATPDEIAALFRFLIAEVQRPHGVIFSAHCHDDLGLALANSLAAVSAGAGQVECTLHGIGERAGNCALEELVMALMTRRDCFNAKTNVDVSQLMAASAVLASTAGDPPRNKAIVGANAFAHGSGIHQHGVLRDRATYEVMRPEDIGWASETIVLSKHSGRHALASRAASIGFALNGPALDDAFAAFKTLADEIGVVDDHRLARLLGSDAGAQA